MFRIAVIETPPKLKEYLLLSEREKEQLLESEIRELATLYKSSPPSAESKGRLKKY